jgi:NitT/TauT family transport system substrate-binding protein
MFSFLTSLQAKDEKVYISYQPGLSYLPLIVMKDQKLMEKRASELGISALKVEWQKFNAPDPIRQGLLSQQIDFGAVGIPSLIKMWDLTRDNIKIKTVGSLAYMPMLLNTSNPEIRSLDDFKEGNIIAMPSIGSSAQALVLQMAASKQYGFDQFQKFDNLTMSIPHPQAQSLLLAEEPEIDAHFASIPFQDFELDNSPERVRTLLNSYDVLGGASTFTLVAASSELREKRPLIFLAFNKAFQDAVDLINESTAKAAQIYLTEDEVSFSFEYTITLLEKPDVSFNIIPKKLYQHAEFMHRIGTIQTMPDSWISLSHPHLHPLSGS